MRARLLYALMAGALVAGAVAVFLASREDDPRFRAVTELAARPSIATTTTAPSTTTTQATTTVPPTTTTTAPPLLTTAPPPATTASPAPSLETTIDLSRADEYGCSHANGCLPYGGDGRSSGELQHEWGCDQGYITEGC